MALSTSALRNSDLSKQGAQTARKEISRERAIEIARERIDFKPKSIKAVKVNEDKRKVWRVTFRGEPISKIHLMGETMIVSVDRLTGEIVSVSSRVSELMLR